MPMPRTLARSMMVWTCLLALFLCAVSAQAQLTPNGSVSGSLNATTTEQTYSFTASADGDANFTLNLTDTLRAYIRFLDSNGTTILSTSPLPNAGGTTTLAIPHLSPGATYYVRADRYTGTGDFTLSNVYTPQSLANDTEPNDTAATALSLPMPAATTGHIGYSRATYAQVDTEDWYAITVPNDCDLALSLTFTDSARGYIRFYDVNGSALQLSSALSVAAGTINLTVPHLAPGGTYFVRVDLYTGHGGYTLSGTLAAIPTQANDIEPNNNAEQANTAFSLASGVQGHIGYSRSSYTDLDTDDWYTLTVPRDGNLTLTVMQGAALRTYLRFYDSNGTTLHFTSNLAAAGVTYTLTIPHLAPGATYYLRVERYTGHGGYKMTGALTSPLVSNDVEPNDTALQATATLPIDGKLNGHIGYSRSSYNDIDTADWYKLTVPRDGDIDLTLSMEAPGRAYLRFYDSNGSSQVAVSNLPPAGGSVSLTMPHLAPGATYYLRIDFYAGYGGYTLSNRFRPMYVPNDTENNDSAASALVPDSLSALTGHIGYSRSSYNDIDTEDWYAFSHPGGNFNAPLQYSDTARGYLRLYNADGVTQRAASSLPAAGGTASLAVTSLPAGDYYLRVHHYAGYGAYSLNPLSTVTISGTILLEDLFGDPQPVTIEFRPADNSAPTIVTVDSGDFSISGLPRMNYNVAIKGAKWLRRTELADTKAGDATGVNVLLRGGDADDSNTVDVLDLDLLIQAFDTCEGDPGFDTGADFNCDGCADVLDLDLLIRNFDQEGDG